MMFPIPGTEPLFQFPRTNKNFPSPTLRVCPGSVARGEPGLNSRELAGAEWG